MILVHLQATVYRWFDQFKSGDLNTDHKPIPGRPLIDHEGRKERLKEAIINDRYITYRDLVAQVNVSTGSIFNLKDELGVEKLKGIWIPHQLTITHKNQRKIWPENQLRIFKNGSLRKVDHIVTGDEMWMFFHTVYQGNKRRWIFSDEPYHEVAKQSNTRNNRMFTIFFNSSSVVHSQFQEEGFAVKSIDYLDTLKKAKQNLVDSGTKNFILHQDNSPVHMSQESKDYYKEDKWQLTNHPPHSPDLSPCDFWLFKEIKTAFRGKKYETDTELALAVDLFIAQIPISEFEKCFKIWFERMDKCIKAEGGYFEMKKRTLKDRNL